MKHFMVVFIALFLMLEIVIGGEVTDTTMVVDSVKIKAQKDSLDSLRYNQLHWGHLQVNLKYFKNKHFEKVDSSLDSIKAMIERKKKGGKK